MNRDRLKQIHGRQAEIHGQIADLKREAAALNSEIKRILGVDAGSVVEDARGKFLVLAAKGGFELLDSKIDGCYLAVPAVFCDVTPENRDGSFDARVKNKQYTHLAPTLSFDAKLGQAID